MTLVGLLTHPEGVEHDAAAETYPAAIVCHSFTGYKEIPHLKALADELAERGIVALRIDFTDCVGESDGSCRDMTLTNQIADLEDALSWLESRGEVDPDRIGVGGHSLGGATSVFVASQDERPAAVVPVAAPATHETERLFQGKEIERWEEMGHIHFPTQRRGEVEIGWQFYEDLQQYDARDAVANIHAPIRFIHGSEDDIVPPSDSEAMYDRANPPKDLQLVDGADHLFRRKEHQREMVTLAADWFAHHL